MADQNLGEALLEFLISFTFFFCGMEFMAWFLHKYVMHGFLWVLHEDHHTPPKHRKWQLNDTFAIIFIPPSMFGIYFGPEWSMPWLSGMGWGITAFGAVYFVVHEVIIHRRWKFFNAHGWYVDALKIAHQHHHRVSGKHGSSNFGMLVPPVRYFRYSKKELNEMFRQEKV